MGLLVLAGVQAAAKIPHSGNEVINNAYCGYPLDITSLWQKEDTMLKISMSNKFQFRMMPEFRGLIWPQRSGDIHYIGGAEILPAPFTIDEEKEILDKLGGLDDQAARSSLIEHNLRLVVYIAKKFDNTGVGVEDLISIGTIGLIKAINTFNPLKNIKLATYASRCIENEILMYLRRNNKVKLEVSIDEPLNVDWDGNELLLSDILGTDENVISKNLEDEVDRRLLRMALNKLSERERVIIEMRFGINTQDGKERTQKEVADIMGISQSYISRLEKKIMKRLKKEIMKME
jgi:RNA polymerase sigma-E factor